MLPRVLGVFLCIVWPAVPAFTQSRPTDFPQLDFSIASADRDGGRGLLDALQHQPPRAAALEVLLRHGYVDEALRVLSRIVDADGPELLPAFKAANTNSAWGRDQRRNAEINATLATIIDRAMVAAKKRPREEAADIARQGMGLRTYVGLRAAGDTWVADLREFMATYEGTAAARLADVDVVMATLPRRQRFEVLEQYARAHDGTVAGARALHEAAGQLRVYQAAPGAEPREADPTERLLRVVALVQELESGRYPPSEWVERAPQLVTGFFVPDSPAPSYAPGNAQRSLDAYGDFVRAHLTWPPPYPPDDPLSYMIQRSMWRLWTVLGDARGRADRFFDDLGAEPTAREAARYLQARTYLLRAREEERGADDARRALRTRGIELLSELARDGSARVRRPAHAMLATELFANAEDERACAEFRRFVEAYPQSDWAWVASLRVGQCEEILQHWQIAASAYRRASAVHADRPLAVLLGHSYAARALEGASDFNAARNEYRAASAAWFGMERARHGLAKFRRPIGPTNAPVGYDPAEVTKPALELRQAELSATLALPGGALLERARWALDHADRAVARDVVTQLLNQFPRSPLAHDARTLAHRVDLEEALTLAAADDPRDMAGAKQRLEQLAREPADAVVCVAKLARATLMAIDGAAGSEALAQEALDDWLKLQIAPSPAKPGSLEADADAIRRVVFRPLGSDLYGREWNAFRWPSVLPPFVVATATLPVQESNGRVTTVAASRPLPGLENTLYLAAGDIELLRKSITRLGGSRRYVPAAIMATPNQPAGASERVMKLWNQFFPMRPGHWGGWEFATYPVITTIEFTNAERTTASVPVVIGYSGGTVLLEKIDGEWRMLKIVNQWIT